MSNWSALERMFALSGDDHADADTSATDNLLTVDQADDAFADALEIDEAEFIITDDDSPPVSVCDRSDAAEDAIRAAIQNKNCRDISIGHLAKNIDTDGDDTNDENQILAIGHPFEATQTGGADDDDKITSISPDDLSGLTGLLQLNLPTTR